MKFKAWLIYTILKLYAKTLKIEIEETQLSKEAKEPVVFAFWHEIILFLPFAYKRKRTLKVLQSPHKDGQLASMIINRFGLRTIWGSSSREPVKALKLMIKELKNGFNIAITPDGPKGPPKTLKGGVLEIAYLTKSPIIPVSGEFSSFIRINSWDKMIIPKPFSKVKFIFKDPIYVEKKGEFDKKRKLLEEALDGP
ncbi:lysophospholipid acyltransferase family protein [Hippea jasoniae]|uniref:lysophospholipid acyltransferase family protein n=1 Tax=Hippea jasoniae TaxID=944479 RepID=UPI0005567F3A|nr:lysophospholipid acyltransferase family protein [Hippea jasoniae]